MREEGPEGRGAEGRHHLLHGNQRSGWQISCARVRARRRLHTLRPAHLPALQPQLQGIGSSARILQGNIAVCGPAVIHVIDQASRSRRGKGAAEHRVPVWLQSATSLPTMSHLPPPSCSRLPSAALPCRCCCPSHSTSRRLTPSPARRRPCQRRAQQTCPGQARCLSPAGAERPARAHQKRVPLTALLVLLPHPVLPRFHFLCPYLCTQL